MFFPKGIFDRNLVAEQIRKEAEADGANVRVETIGEWIFIKGDKDWLEASPDAFDKMMPHTLTGPNSLRWEIVLTALAKDVVTATKSETKTIKGAPLKIKDSDFERLVAFR